MMGEHLVRVGERDWMLELIPLGATILDASPSALAERGSAELSFADVRSCAEYH